MQMVEMDFNQRTAKVVYEPGKTEPGSLVAAVSSNDIFEASVLPQQHPTGQDLRGPDPRDERSSQNKDLKEKQKGNNGGI